MKENIQRLCELASYRSCMMWCYPGSSPDALKWAAEVDELVRAIKLELEGGKSCA